jgi:hypothetical protein
LERRFIAAFLYFFVREAMKRKDFPIEKLAVLAFLALVAAGCGGGTQQGIHVSGKVTFQKKPVPYGKIFFNPAYAGGGTTGYAEISNGQYNTNAAKGKAVPHGTVAVMIHGYDAADQKKMLFRHEIQIVLDQSATTKDFDVPDGAAVKGDPGPPP